MSSHPTVRLGEICRPRQWKTLSKKDLVTDGFPVYGANGKIGFACEFTHSKPTLLIGCRGSCGSVHITEPFSYANGNAMALDELNEERFETKYLYHYFLHRGFQDVITGTSQPQIIQQHLRQVEIPLPPLEEQRRIAAILDKASSLSSRLACAVKLEDEFNASLFDKLVGDPVVNAKDFPRARLADLCASADDIKCGPFGTQLKQHEFRATGVPLWGIKHVNRRFEIPTSEFIEEDTATRLSTYSLEPGDIVMTRKGTVGNCSVYPVRLPSGIMHSDLLRIRLDETRCLPSFAAYQLHHSTDIKRQIDLISGGAIMAGINVGRLKEVKIVLPGLDIQKEFESLASRGSWLVWQKNQGMIRRSRELLQSLSGGFFLGSQSGQTKT
jgi:type I restriction enzyme S subunit